MKSPPLKFQRRAFEFWRLAVRLRSRVGDYRPNGLWFRGTPQWPNRFGLPSFCFDAANLRLGFSKMRLSFFK